MTDRRHRRLELLRRLRGMRVEQARADHVAAQTDLDQKRAQADDTQRRIAALDDWAAEQITRGAPLLPEVMHQAQMFRVVEKNALDLQRDAEEASRLRMEEKRSELAHQFEDLSVAERLSRRHQQAVAHDQLRRGYLELDEAGAQRKNLEAKE